MVKRIMLINDSYFCLCLDQIHILIVIYLGDFDVLLSLLSDNTIKIIYDSAYQNIHDSIGLNIHDMTEWVFIATSYMILH